MGAPVSAATRRDMSGECELTFNGFWGEQAGSQHSRKCGAYSTAE